MNSLLLASTFLPATARPRPGDAYDDLYKGPRTSLMDTLRLGAALGAIVTYAGLLALI